MRSTTEGALLLAQHIILFGGTFDPVHLGHTAVAEHAFRELRADRVIFIPARRSPHKLGAPLALAEHRFNMLSLAIAGHKSFSVDTCEVERAEPSYTYDTVMDFRKRMPEAQLSWLLGADTVASLPMWYRIDEILGMCDIRIMSRGGMDAPAFDKLEPALSGMFVEKLRKNAIQTPLIPISSSEVRARFASGGDVLGMLNPSVLNYIKQHGLYGVPRGE